MRTLWIGHQEASSACQQHFQRRVNNIELEMKAHKHFAQTDTLQTILIYILLATASISTGPWSNDQLDYQPGGTEWEHLRET